MSKGSRGTFQIVKWLIALTSADLASCDKRNWPPGFLECRWCTLTDLYQSESDRKRGILSTTDRLDLINMMW